MDQAQLAQVAQHAREGFGRNAQLGGDEAFALVQGDLHGAAVVGLSVVQQPLCAARFGILREAAHGQFRLLPVALGHVQQQAPRARRHGGQTALERLDGHAPHMHAGVGHHVHRQRQAQQGRRGIEPERPLDGTELVAQETVVQHAAQHTAAFEVQHRRQHLIAPAQHFAGSDDLGVSGQRKKGRWQHGSHCAVRLRLRH